MNDYGKPQNGKANQDDQAHELIEQLNLLETVDRRITPEHIERRFRELLDDIGDADLVDSDAAMEAVVAAARGAAADIIADAEQKAQASRGELRRAQGAVVAARQQAEQIVAAAREEADEALKQAAKMVREAGEQAARIIADAHREAEEIIKAAQEEQLTKAYPLQLQNQAGISHARNITQSVAGETPVASADVAVLDNDDLGGGAHNDLEWELRNDATWSHRMFEEIHDFLAVARTGWWSADRAVTELYSQHYRGLVRLAALLARDVPTAEEVVQDAFVAMHDGWQRLRDADKAVAYLRKAVVNRSRSVLRHRGAVDKNLQKPSPDMASAEHGALTLLERSAVVAALRELPDRQREAIVLRYYADLPEAEIAAAMGISRGAVKSHTARGMAALRAALERSDGAGDDQDRRGSSKEDAVHVTITGDGVTVASDGAEPATRNTAPARSEDEASDGKPCPAEFSPREPLLATSLPHYRAIVALDIERSTSRPDRVKAELRNKIYELFDAALRSAGIHKRHRDRFIDRGDGVLALIHPVDQAPKALLLNRAIPALNRLLADYNASLPPPSRPQQQLRARVVMHAGEVHYDANGCFGEALDVAFRLLDAPQVKRALREAADPLILVISGEIYSSLVRHGYDGIDQQTFHPVVHVQIAGNRYRGWTHIPGQAAQHHVAQTAWAVRNVSRGSSSNGTASGDSGLRTAGLPPPAVPISEECWRP